MSEVIDIDSINIHIAQMEHLIFEQNSKDIILDFNQSKTLKPDGMLRLCSFTKLHINSDIVFRIDANKNHKIRKEIISNNWGNLIDTDFPVSAYKGFLYQPTSTFTNPDNQQELVNDIMNMFLSAFPDLSRESFGSIEWVVNEIMDNVVVHSESNVGGLVQVRILRNVGKDIEVVVSDSGVGIPSTLKSAYPKKNNRELLVESIKEEVTNGKGQGNGLFGATQVCRNTDGDVKILSGDIAMKFLSHEGICTRPINSRFSGTTFYAKIRTVDIDLLENALVFSGRVYHPTDFIEINYENVIDASNYKYTLSKSKDAVGSRIYGKTLRQRLINLLKMSEDINTIEIDFSEITMISSSFADELIAKIIEAHGLQFFSDHIFISNCNEKIKSIIDKVSIQRNSCKIQIL